mgnify:FL=1
MCIKWTSLMRSLRKYAGKIIFPALGAFMLFGCARSTKNLSPVSPFDIEKYAGKWHEQVRYDHRFERGLSSVTAKYTITGDGKVSVLNRGYDREKGEWSSAKGTAKFKGSKNVGLLKVTFFRPFWGTYKIIYLDEEYQHAIVTGSSYKYFWMLTRKPDIERSKLEELIEKGIEFGFERNKMIIVKHFGNLE